MKSFAGLPTSEAYKRVANRFAEHAIGYSTPSIAAVLLALALNYVSLADMLDQPVVPQEEQQ